MLVVSFSGDGDDLPRRWPGCELAPSEEAGALAARTRTRREILDHVWDYEIDGDSNIVEVYIRYLRRKVDIPFGRAAIETVRGFGYRLAADGG